jgi:hypothetical protein
MWLARSAVTADGPSGRAEMNRRPDAAIEGAIASSYEAPAIEDRAPIAAPLNTVAATIKPLSPRWRSPESD